MEESSQIHQQLVVNVTANILDDRDDMPPEYDDQLQTDSPTSLPTQKENTSPDAPMANANYLPNSSSDVVIANESASEVAATIAQAPSETILPSASTENVAKLQSGSGRGAQKGPDSAIETIGSGHDSNENVASQPPQQAGNGYLAQERLIWPPGSRKWLFSYRFIGAFEIILGLYFAVFGIVSIIVVNPEGKYYIAGYGGVSGLGALLLLSGIIKLCRSPSNNILNILLSFLGFLIGGGVAVYSILMIPSIKSNIVNYNEYENFFTPMVTVAAVTCVVAALLCLMHVVCYVRGRRYPLQQVHVIVYTNVHTGERFFERVVPKKVERRRVDSFDDNMTEVGYPARSQTLPHQKQHAIPMSNIGRSVSMKTIENQYVKRQNRELPQQFFTVQRQPHTMQQYRQQEMQYAQSEFSIPPTQTTYRKDVETHRPYAQTEFANTRAMTDINYPQTSALKSGGYAQSDVGQPRAMTDVDYPQPLSTQAIIENQRAATEVDYRPQRTIPAQQYTQSEVRFRTMSDMNYRTQLEQPRAMTEVNHQQPRAVESVQVSQPHVRPTYAVSETSHKQQMPNQPSASPEYRPRAVTTGVNYSQSTTLPRQQFPQPGQGVSERTMHPQSTPTHQYVQSVPGQPSTIARYPQPSPDHNYQANVSQAGTLQQPADPGYDDRLPRTIHPQAEMGYRTAPTRGQYEHAPSEAGMSYAPSDAGYPVNQSGRISPRVALARRQMEIQARQQQEAMQRRFVAEGGNPHANQRYIVQTRPHR